MRYICAILVFLGISTGICLGLPVGIVNGNFEMDGVDDAEPPVGWTDNSSSASFWTGIAGEAGNPSTGEAALAPAPGLGSYFLTAARKSVDPDVASQPINSLLQQTIDLSSFGTAIDGGGESLNVEFIWASNDRRDTAVFSLEFYASTDGSGASLGTYSVTLDDGNNYNFTGWIEETVGGTVPTGARSVTISIAVSRTDGTENNIWFDNITGEMHSSLVYQTVEAGSSDSWNGPAIWGGATAEAGVNYFSTATYASGQTNKLNYNSLLGRVRALDGTAAFAGDSLTLSANTELLIHGINASTATVDNLILDGGLVRYSPDGGGTASVTLAGGLTVSSNSVMGIDYHSSPCSFTLDSTLSGSGDLYLRAGGAGNLTLAVGGDLSGYTGDLILSGGDDALSLVFNQDYDLPDVDVVMGTFGTADSIILDRTLAFSSFTFGSNSLPSRALFTADDLNAVLGNGTQFSGSGTVSVYNTPLPPPPGTFPSPARGEMNVMIVGDSTVMTRTTGEIRGWGQYIGDYFNGGVVFNNLASAGHSSKSFIDNFKWVAEAVLETNDYVLIQFGHVDSLDPANPESTDAFGDYQTYLQQYIDETRAAGAIPVLVTPMYRRSFDVNGNLLSYYLDGGQLAGDLEPYADAMQQVAISNNVTCVDLFTMSGEFMQPLGDSACAELQVSGDISNWNEKGAISMAGLICRGLVGSGEPLEEFLIPGIIPPVFAPGSSVAVDAPSVSGTAVGPADFPLVESGTAATVVYAANDAEVVEVAAGLFAEDVARISGVLPVVETSVSALSGPVVVIGTLGQSPHIDALVSNGLVNVSGIEGGWEQYRIEVVDNPYPGVPKALVIVGSDRRGTAYGVFSLSEEMGVSPWYWWADSGTTGSIELHVDATPFTSKTPSVRYRGIFINDEDWGLQEWAEKNYESGDGEVKDLGPKSYAKIFELLLRLKANYCWPGMHPSTKAFNHYTDNKLVADRYAIVMGSSHSEAMLRNNVFEWYNDIDPVTGETFSQGSWNYEDNPDGINRYWEQRAIVNGAYENVYTLGKRGVHDSAMVEGSNTLSKANMINTIFAAQREILSNHVNPDLKQVAQSFVPYKEVLAIYDSGLVNVPNDVTLIWPDDNHGYIRRLSDPVEQLRSGGGGIYYHISYWGKPEDYLWICSTPPSLIWEEMTKAYAYNCGRLWVVNVGDIKPAEICTEFFMRLAWDVNRYDENAQEAWLTEWAEREYGEAYADEVVDILNGYYRLGQERKPEHMYWEDLDKSTPAGTRTLFSHVHYGDEASLRLAEYETLAAQANALYASLPAERKSSFFQTVLYPLLGAEGMNRKFLNAGRAYVAAMQNRRSVATHIASSEAGHTDIQTETAIYNSIEGGKWNEIMVSNPRNRTAFKPSPLPVAPVFGSGVLGVAVEGRLDAAYLPNAPPTNPVPNDIYLSATTNYSLLVAPMVVTDIAGKPAIWTPGSDGIIYAPGVDGKVEYTFDVEYSASYTLSFEVNCPSGKDDSWHIQMDDGITVVWNDLGNGGVWTWETFGNVYLEAGTHTLKVYKREDGAAMANISLVASVASGNNPVLVEDAAMTGFELPEFNARTQRPYFIDLFNTGVGSVDWVLTPQDPWVEVSQTSGTLDSELRVWVSIDWAFAPKGDAVTSSVSVAHSGATLEIPVSVWNPAASLPLEVDFVEDNRVVSIEAENYSELVAAYDSTWRLVPNLGRGDGVMMVSPTTAASRESVDEVVSSSSVLVYDTHLRSAGTVTVSARFIPTLAINGMRGLRYAVAFDDETPQIVDMTRTSGGGDLWYRSVMRGNIEYATSHTLSAGGAHKLKIWMVDPGVVLDRIQVTTGDVPYTYRGAPETEVESYGSYSIASMSTLIVPPDQSITFESVTNNGTLVLLGTATLNVGGTFVNNGVLDISTWQGVLPDTFINNGTVIDRSDTLTRVQANMFIIEIYGYEGLAYQLQEMDNGSLIDGKWLDVGSPVPGANAPITFSINTTSAKTGFFRIGLVP